MPSRSDAFEVLGLARDCTLTQAQRQFKKLALRFHPDKVPADQKETATMKMALFNAAMDKVRDILERSPPTPWPSPSRQRYRRFEPDPNADDQCNKATRSLQHQHAQLLHKMSSISQIITTRTQAHALGAPGLCPLISQLKLVMQLVQDGDLKAALASTENVQATVESLRKRVMELERRANARRTVGGQYRPEEVEAYNCTMASLIADYFIVADIL